MCNEKAPDHKRAGWSCVKNKGVNGAREMLMMHHITGRRKLWETEHTPRDAPPRRHPPDPLLTQRKYCTGIKVSA